LDPLNLVPPQDDGAEKAEISIQWRKGRRRSCGGV
jgi:hypothetical protein